MIQAVREKADLIADSIYSILEDRKDDTHYNGLYGGDCGMLLFLFYYTTVSDSPRYKALINNLTDRILDSIENGRFVHTFSNGLAGILYLFDFLKKQGFTDIDITEYEEVLETYLIRKMNNDIQSCNYDFMHGALGTGLYFLKKQKRKDIILQLVDFLYHTAEKDSGQETIKWKFSFVKDSEPKYNISLSHGISGVVLFLSRMVRENIVHPKIYELLNGSVNYMLKQERDAGIYGSCFPGLSLDDAKTASLKSRLAWCYGDLGTAYAIWFAGKTIHNISWQKKGLDILVSSTSRAAEAEPSVVDAAICHGASGIAMVYRRMYLETRDDVFLKASGYWIDQTLLHAVFSDGPAGYKSFYTNRWEDDYSLLTGISGIGLMLISYLMEDSQDWDELFLLS